MWVGWVWEYNCTLNVLTLNIYNPNHWLIDSVLQCRMRNRHRGCEVGAWWNTTCAIWAIVKVMFCLMYVMSCRAMQSDLVTHAQIIHIELSFTPWDWSPGDPTPCPSVYLADITPAPPGAWCLAGPGHSVWGLPGMEHCLNSAGPGVGSVSCSQARIVKTLFAEWLLRWWY